MNNIRKMFDDVNVTGAAEQFPFMVARMLEHRIKFSGSVGVADYRSNTSLGLSVEIAHDRLAFEVTDNRDDRLVLKRSDIVLADVPEWPVYVSKSLISLDGQGRGEVEGFLQGAFSIARSSPLQRTVHFMAERIGVRVGNDLELVLGDGPHSLESKDIYANLAHIALSLSPQMRVILTPDDKQVKEARERYNAEARLDPLRPL